MYRHVDRATSDVQEQKPLSVDVQAATLVSLSALPTSARTSRETMRLAIAHAKSCVRTQARKRTCLLLRMWVPAAAPPERGSCTGGGARLRRCARGVKCARFCLKNAELTHELTQSSRRARAQAHAELTHELTQSSRRAHAELMQSSRHGSRRAHAELTRSSRRAPCRAGFRSQPVDKENLHFNQHC